MDRIKLLDCTLRDGGYAVNWDFGHNSIINIYSRLIASGVDIIEVGYLRDADDFNIDRTSNPSVKDFAKVYDVDIKNKPMIVAMIDLGRCKIENICPKSESFIDGIRVTFKKTRIDEVIDFAKKVSDLGYKVFLQSVSITDYTDDEYVDMIKRINTINPYAVSIVDTYGLMHMRDLLRYFYLLDHNLNKDAYIGYHPHNNFQIAYSNALEIIAQDTDRKIVIDATVNGIGKDSGNACTELLAHYMNEHCNKNYDISYLLDIIDSELNKLREKTTWGYSFIGFISASNGCRTEYTKFLLNKKQLSIKAINEILSRIDRDKKTTDFHKEHIEKLYNEYLRNGINDQDSVLRLKNELVGKKLLLLAPGNSINDEREKIEAYISTEKPIVIAANHIPTGYSADYIFISNNLRYGRMIEQLKKLSRSTKIIITSNITPEEDMADYILNYAKIADEFNVSENSMLLLLSFLAQVGVENVNLAGFDGFSSDENKNYFSEYLVFEKNTHTDSDNEKISEVLEKISEKMKLNFITKTFYTGY